MNFNKLFSLKKEKQAGHFSKRTITFLGMNFSFYRHRMSDVISELSSRVFCSANANLIFTAFQFAQNTSENELFCLKNQFVCFIFNNKILDFGYDNFKDFIWNSLPSRTHLFELEKLNKTSTLYKDHIHRLQNNEFLWKYSIVGKIIIHQFLSFDNQGFYVNEAISGDEEVSDIDHGKCYIQAKKSKRPFYDGVTIKEYIKDKPYAVQKDTCIKLIEYIFSTYTIQNDMIDGKLFDCHAENFIYDKNNQFHFIDDTYVSKTPLSKEYIITRLFNGDRPILTNDLLIHFGFQPLLLPNEPTDAEMKNEQLLSKAEHIKNKYFIKY